jgi:hypothetical protein
MPECVIKRPPRKACVRTGRARGGHPPGLGRRAPPRWRRQLVGALPRLIPSRSLHNRGAERQYRGPHVHRCRGGWVWFAPTRLSSAWLWGGGGGGRVGSLALGACALPLGPGDAAQTAAGEGAGTGGPRGGGRAAAGAARLRAPLLVVPGLENANALQQPRPLSQGRRPANRPGVSCAPVRVAGPRVGSRSGGRRVARACSGLNTTADGGGPHR